MKWHPEADEIERLRALNVELMTALEEAFRAHQNFLSADESAGIWMRAGAAIAKAKQYVPSERSVWLT